MTGNPGTDESHIDHGSNMDSGLVHGSSEGKLIETGAAHSDSRSQPVAATARPCGIDAIPEGSSVVHTKKDEQNAHTDGSSRHVPAQADDYESNRLEVLVTQNLMFTDGNTSMDSYACVAKRTFGTPIALITLIDAEREWFLSNAGLETLHQVSLTTSIGQHVIKQGDNSALVVLDLLTDERFMNNELVVKHPNARFYAGAPLIITRKNVKYRIGTLCVMDTHPRMSFDAKDVFLLQLLATSCVREIESRPLKDEGIMAPLKEEGGIDKRVQELKVFIPFSRRKVDEGCIRMIADKLKPRKVDEGCIRMIADKLKPRIVHTGQFVTRVGDCGDTLFFVASGSCICTLNNVELERLLKGQCFGEVALLNMCKIRAMGTPIEQARLRCTRNADVIALERCELLEFCFEEAWPLLKKAPNLWYTLEDMAKRRTLCATQAANAQ